LLFCRARARGDGTVRTRGPGNGSREGSKRVLRTTRQWRILLRDAKTTSDATAKEYALSPASRAARATLPIRYTSFRRAYGFLNYFRTRSGRAPSLHPPRCCKLCAGKTRVRERATVVARARTRYCFVSFPHPLPGRTRQQRFWRVCAFGKACFYFDDDDDDRVITPFDWPRCVNEISNRVQNDNRNYSVGVSSRFFSTLHSYISIGGTRPSWQECGAGNAPSKILTLFCPNP
jgi:hypothetical protein